MAAQTEREANNTLVPYKDTFEPLVGAIGPKDTMTMVPKTSIDHIDHGKRDAAISILAIALEMMKD